MSPCPRAFQRAPHESSHHQRLSGCCLDLTWFRLRPRPHLRSPAHRHRPLPSPCSRPSLLPHTSRGHRTSPAQRSSSSTVRSSSTSSRDRLRASQPGGTAAAGEVTARGEGRAVLPGLCRAAAATCSEGEARSTAQVRQSSSGHWQPLNSLAAAQRNFDATVHANLGRKSYLSD